MDYKRLLEYLGNGYQIYKIENELEIYDLYLNLIATIKEKDGEIKYSVNKGFNKLTRLKKKMVLYELNKFCRELMENKGD